MERVVLYYNNIPLRFLFLLEVILGSILVFLFTYLFICEIYLDVWTFAGPLLGLAILITGLTSSKIKDVNIQSSNKSIIINRESLFKRKVIQINPYQMTVELKTANGKKYSLIPQLILVILINKKEIEKLESGFLSMNNSKIKKLHKDLKSIIEIINTSSTEI